MTARRATIAALACLLAAPAAASAASAGYGVSASWGREGSGPGEFGSGVLGGGANRQYDDPAGIAVSPLNGNVVVVDTSNNRVQRFTREGRFLGAFGRRGQDKGFVEVRLTNRLFQPEGVAVDRAGAIFVADAGNDRSMAYSPTGRFRARLGYHGSLPGQLVQPWGIATAGSLVYVIDQGNYQIDRYTKRGRYRGAFGRFGRGRGQLVTPYGIAVAGGRVYVSDHVKHEVMAFSTAGRFLGAFGGPGTGAGRFLKPAGVAIGPDGTVFVADRCNRRVQRFTAGGAFLESFGARELETPTFLAVDRRGDVFVSDHHRVVRFSPGARALARPSSHDRVDIQCRGVRELVGA